MSTPISIKRDLQKRTLLSKQIIPQLVHKTICSNCKINNLSTQKYGYKEHARVLHHSPLNKMQTRIKNRCILSGRSKAVYRFCRLSRIRIRELANKGLLNGVTKSSW
ncbi:MAG: 30S ribosomal protein S14 [Sphingobacteriaceae bacterium]|nr:MAG: 30S ribosomal protein S14 [Sphingobacteriaceae bacterium]